MTPFKIGSIYRQKNGELVRLCAIDPSESVYIKAAHDRYTPRGVVVEAQFVTRKGGDGWRFLETGRYVCATEDADNGSTLQAGELNAQGEPIAPTFYCAAETLKPAVPKAMLSVTSWDLFYDTMAEELGLPPLASAAAWIELGRAIAPCGIPRGVHDGIVIYGIEATYVAAETLKAPVNEDYPEPWGTVFASTPQTLKVRKPQQYTLRTEPAKVHDSDCALHNAPALPPGPCDCSAAPRQHQPFQPFPISEKVRPPLDWADSKAADRFPGYITTRDTATPDHAYSHPLTRVADAGAQTPGHFGSADLVS